MISKSPSDKDRFSYDAHFFPSARYAWSACLRQLAPRRILLPAYIGFTMREGSGLLDPVCELNVACSFYPVDRNVRVKSDVIKECLAQQSDIDMVLLVHYFGWPGGDTRTIKAACDEAGALLVEDCAHAFQWGHPNQELGITGSYAFYSLHKHLPVPAGGLLCINEEGCELSDQFHYHQMDVSIVESLARADLRSIAAQRRDNLRQLYDGIQGIEGLSTMTVDIPLVPHSLPVWIEGTGVREKLYFNLLNRQIPTTALYYQLHKSLEQSLFPTSFAVSEHILNLPIHQDLTSDDIATIVKVLPAALRDVRG